MRRWDLMFQENGIAQSPTDTFFLRNFFYFARKDVFRQFFFLQLPYFLVLVFPGGGTYWFPGEFSIECEVFIVTGAARSSSCYPHFPVFIRGAVPEVIEWHAKGGGITEIII